MSQGSNGRGKHKKKKRRDSLPYVTFPIELVRRLVSGGGGSVDNGGGDSGSGGGDSGSDSGGGGVLTPE